MTFPDSLTPSMWLRYANGATLISAGTAVSLVRLILADEFGNPEVESNEPLSVRDDGDAWLVTGSKLASAGRSETNAPGWGGPIRARISKFDGQILEYAYTLAND